MDKNFIKKDAQLIAEIKQGEVSSFEILIKRYEARLLNFVIRFVKKEEDAEEIVQDSFFSLYKTIEKVDTSKKFSTYLFQIAKNRSFSYLRKTKNELPLSDAHVIREDHSLYDNLDEKIKKEKLKNIINRLQKKYKEIVKLYYFEELSYAEIAKRIKIPLNSVRTRLRRAKEKLKTILKNERT